MFTPCTKLRFPCVIPAASAIRATARYWIFVRPRGHGYVRLSYLACVCIDVSLELLTIPVYLCYGQSAQHGRAQVISGSRAGCATSRLLTYHLRVAVERDVIAGAFVCRMNHAPQRISRVSPSVTLNEPPVSVVAPPLNPQSPRARFRDLCCRQCLSCVAA